MNIVVLSIGLILAIGGIIMACLKESIDFHDIDISKKKFKLYAGILTVAGIALFVFGCSFTIISTGEVGVRTYLGQIKSETAAPGFAWKIPFLESIQKVNTKQRDLNVGGQIWSETSERTAIYYENITITYSISPDRAAWIYANVSNYKDSLISGPLVSSAVKVVSKEYNSTDATSRAIVEPRIQQELQKSLDEKYEEGTVYIYKVSVSNIDFEETYNQAIAEKQNAQIAYETTQIQNQTSVDKAQAEADAKIIQKEADAKAKVIDAQAEADALKIKAEAEADANRTIADSLNNNIFTQKMLEKWDGALPKVTDGSNAMFDYSDIIK